MGAMAKLCLALFAVALLAVLACAAAAPNTHPNAGAWAKEAGVGYPGHNMAPCGGKTKEVCKADCLSDTKCVGFFYGANKQCCLKFKKGNASSESGDFYSKPKPNAEAPKPRAADV